MSDVALLGIDWGSSSVRALAIAPDGAVVDVRRADDGVFTGTGAFDERLRRHLGDWLARWPAASILLCGMIGSDRGWVHAPYVTAPAGLEDIARSLAAVPFERTTRLVPGLSFASGGEREVMRGEETLLFGLDELPATSIVCLPGTHSKWVDLAGGRIVRFRTYMTGELRAALLSAGALATAVPQIASRDAFLAGFEAAQSGAAPTRALFQARARRLLGTLDPAHTASFVSGVLIGAEIAAEAGRPAPIVLVARGALAEEYGVALAEAGMRHTLADPEVLAAKGLLRIARRAKLLAN